MMHDVVQEVLQQLKTPGKRVEDVTIDTTLGVLRDRTVKWMWKAFANLNKPEIVKKVYHPSSLQQNQFPQHRHGQCVSPASSICLMTA